MYKDFFRKYVSPCACVSFCVMAVCVVLKLVSMLFAPFADFFNRYAASLTRGALAYVSALVPFSLAEAILLAAIPLALIYVIHCATSRKRLARHIINLFGVIFIVISVFTVNNT